ncbi:Serine/threonine-protein kinase [Friedmanniomyces endolithicus]|nr:Serine/threonine-protein kinase [Friedmanniomyces endolithicus]
MGQGYSTSLPLGPSAVEVAELSDLTFEKPLGGARFLRTVRARHQHGLVVVKVCAKANSSITFKTYGQALRQQRSALAGIPNVLPYARIRETRTVGLLVRQYVHSSLYDRISIRPFLENIEKKWIAFQLLCALRDCHAREIFHGDIKTENVLVTSWCWVYLVDFAATFKLVYLPEDNPADFSYYYDTSNRRTCYLAPERFLAAGQAPHESHKVQWNMDIFSMGCVLAELFTETPTFTLSQLFRYRRGEYDPTVSLLNKVDDVHMRSLISSMIRLDPGERWHASDYLDEYKSKAFPLYFYQHLHVLMQELTDPTSGRKQTLSAKSNNGLSDDRIDKVYDDFEMLAVSLNYGDILSPTPQHPVRPARTLFPLQVDLPNNRHAANSMLAATGDNGTFILLNVVTASLRSAGRAYSKIRACELLLAFAERLPDEAKMDRILPYIMPLLDDSESMVLVAALRSLTQLLALVTVVSPVNSFLFTQYIFPRLQAFVKTNGFKNNSIVRETYAACLASLAETASRFLDMMQALRAEGSLPSSDKAEGDGYAAYHDAYDATRLEVLDAFEGQTKVFLTDTDTAVRRAFLTAVPSLCVFFGEVRASDIILSHLNTYLNDPDWLLKCAFFRAIVGVAVYIGGASLEDFILPLMLQALADPQDFVVERALRSLASMAEFGLLQRPKTWELIDTIARFQLHPNVWIKEAAAHFVFAATTYLSIADGRTLVTPLIQPYLKVPVSILSESDLLDALKKPIPRTVLDMAMEWAKRTDRGIFWKTAREGKQLSYRAIAQMPPTSSVSEFGAKALGKVPKNDEDEQWLGRLRNAGMRGEDEMKLLAFREYIWRAAQRTKKDSGIGHDQIYDQIIALRKLDINAQTVIFDGGLDTYEQRMRDEGHSERTIAEALEEAAGPTADTTLQKLSLRGIPESRAGGNAGALNIPTDPRSLSGLRKQTSGSLSSSPSSGVGLLAKEGDRSARHRGNAGGLLNGSELRIKALPEVAMDDTTAAGRLQTPIQGSRRVSPAPVAGQRARGLERAADHRAIHNYPGNDPTVLKLLDAVYVDTFPAAAAEFGPTVQATKRGPIRSTSAHSQTGPWRPEGQLVGVLSEHTARVTRIVVAPDHMFFLTGSDDGTVKVWDAGRLERNVTHRTRQTYRLAPGVKVTSLCFVDSTHTFVCTGSDGSVHVVKVEVTEQQGSTRYAKLRNLRDWQIPTDSQSGEHAVWADHYRGDSTSTLVLATNIGRILAVDLRYTVVEFDLHNLPEHGMPTCFCIGRKRDWLLVGTTHGVLSLWDLRFRLRLRSWTFSSATPITRLQLHPSRKSAKRNRVCVSGGTTGGEVTVWDVEKVICHEVYRPAHAHSKDRLHLRDYELRNLDEERSDGLLSRVAGAVATDANTSESDTSGPAVITAIHFGLHQAPEDAEALHAFALTGGPDGKLRFWDCDRLEGCRVVSGGSPGEKSSYSFSQLGLDTRVLTEKLLGDDDSSAPANAVESSKTASNNPAKRPSSSRTGVKPSRYETIRLSAQRLLDGHLDTITDVALLERPYGMAKSGNDPNFASRAQSAGAKNDNAGSAGTGSGGGGTTGGQSGGGRGGGSTGSGGGKK